MKKIRNAVELSVMCATLVLSLMLCSFVLNRQASSNELRVRNFYREQADSLDVVQLLILQRLQRPACLERGRVYQLCTGYFRRTDGRDQINGERSSAHPGS